MDERYDPAYQRGSTTEPAQQPKTRSGGRARETAAHPRKHPLHETEHWQPAGGRSTAPHLDTADSAGPHALIGSAGGSETDTNSGAEGIDVFRPLGIVEDDVPAEIPHVAPAPRQSFAAPSNALRPIGRGDDAASRGMFAGATIGRDPASGPRASADAGIGARPHGTGSNGTSIGSGSGSTRPGTVHASDAGDLDAIGADDFGTAHLDDDQTARTRNPWEGALWVIGIALVVFGAFALWQSVQRSMYGWSGETGPPDDFLTNLYLGELAPGVIAIGLATIVGLLFRRLFAHDRRSRP